MGLGKTAQALAIIAHDIETNGRPDAPTLVVAPTSVVTNWLREAERFAPKLRVALHHGSAREDPTGYLGDADVVVTSYGVMRRDEQLPRHRVAPGRARRGAGDQEPDHRHHQGRAQAQGRRADSSSPARRSRTISASSGA